MAEDILHIAKFDESSALEFQFQYKSRSVVFQRPADEALEKFIQRCYLKLNGPTKKKKFGSQSNVTNGGDSNITVSFLSAEEQPLSSKLPLHVVALNENNKMQINDVVYRIVINRPRITSARLPEHMMATYIIQPIVELDFSTHFTVSWHISLGGSLFTPVSEDSCFEPSIANVGAKVKSIVTPWRDVIQGDPIEVHSADVIQAPVGETPLTIRQQLVRMTSQSYDADFRVVSYNILADCYVFTEFALQTMYPLCPQYCLSMDYRKQILYKEFLDYNASVYSLQEVELSFYETQLRPFFEILDYYGLFSTPDGSRRKSDGEALFFAKSVFTLLHDQTFSINEYCYEVEIVTCFLACCSKELREDFLCRTTTFQACTLRHTKTGNILLVVNVHFAAKHNFDAVRLLQTITVSTFMIQQSEELKKQHPESNIGILFLGDLNSSPDSFAIRYLHQETLDIEELDPLSAGVDFKLRLPNCLNILESCYPKFSIEFTNFVMNFNAVLDWIFFNSDVLKCVNRLPMPSLESIAAYGCLPNVGIASDHLALVADFSFIPKS